MNPFLFTDDEEKKYALACLKFSKKLGLIDDDSLGAVIKRCDAENEKRKLQKENNETVYGLTHFSYPAYLDYELTKAKKCQQLRLIEVKCSVESRSNLGRPTTLAIENKENFMKYLKML